MFRIGLFLMTNLAIILVASVTLNLLGVGSYLDETGTGLDLQSLLIFCAVFGFAGSFISLLISKWMAKRATGTKLITQPRTEREQWLVQTVREALAKSRHRHARGGDFSSPTIQRFRHRLESQQGPGGGE